jgi:hypothetical protein
LLIDSNESPGLHTYSSSSKTFTLGPLLAVRCGTGAPAEAADLSDPEASGEEGGVGIGNGAGTPRAPEVGDEPVPAGAAE